MDDHELACELAEQAGRRLLALRADGGQADQLRKAGDRLSHEYLMAELARVRPGDAVLSEEGADDKARLAADRVWIIDPLDGTREFGEPGRTDWAVHVALWEDGDLAAGAVALPAQDRVLCTQYLGNGRQRAAAGQDWPGELPPEAAQDEPLRIMISRSRPAEFMARLADELGAVLVPMGSAGAKAAAVITGEADAYVHAGGQYEWDSAAPVAVARAAGLHASRISGADLAYNQADPWVPDILICPIGFAHKLISAISRATAAGQPGGPANAEPQPSDQEPS